MLLKDPGTVGSTGGGTRASIPIHGRNMSAVKIDQPSTYIEILFFLGNGPRRCVIDFLARPGGAGREHHDHYKGKNEQTGPFHGLTLRSL